MAGTTPTCDNSRMLRHLDCVCAIGFFPRVWHTFSRSYHDINCWSVRCVSGPSMCEGQSATRGANCEMIKMSFECSVRCASNLLNQLAPYHSSRSERTRSRSHRLHRCRHHRLLRRRLQFVRVFVRRRVDYCLMIVVCRRVVAITTKFAINYLYYEHMHTYIYEYA